MTEIIVSAMPMMVCGILSVLLALSLYDRPDRPRSRMLLFMLTASMLYTAHCVYFNQRTAYIPLTDTLYSFCNPAVYPLFYIYIEELTEYRPSTSRQLLYLVPATLCCLSVGLLYALMDVHETSNFIQHYLYADDHRSLTGLARWQATAHDAVRVVFALELIPVLMLGFKHITAYNRVVDSNYSNTEGKHIIRVKTLLVLFTATSAASFICNIIGRYQFAESTALLAIPSLLFSLLLLCIGHVALSQQFHIRDVMEDFLEAQAVIPEAVGADEHYTQDQDITEEIQPKSKLAERIQKIVIDEQLYLQPNLKISDLSMRLNTNRNYIYNAINVEMRISFSDFINRQRIDYADMLMKENPEMPISEVITASGFTSSSSFYRNYKKFKGGTPAAH